MICLKSTWNPLKIKPLRLLTPSNSAAQNLRIFKPLQLLLTTMLRSLSILCICLLAPFIGQAQDDQNPCVQSQAYHVVVLGSSTAAGSGPSVSDSTWVNRYRAWLQSINPANQVTNLAQGGTTTYHIMPDWFTAPAGRPNANPARNVSQAISLGADAIVVNMPSNDAANNFSVTEQMFNFRTIVASADSAGIPVWVCTTQPRNFGATQIQTQLEVRDSVHTEYGQFAIDFWNPFASVSNTIDPLYDSGDGVHLNDLAHRFLFQKVRDENILSAVYDTLQIEEHVIFDFQILNPSACGDSATTIIGVVTNLGQSSSYDLPVNLHVDDMLGGSQVLPDTIIGGVGSCTADTVIFEINTYDGADLVLQMNLATLNDSLLSNDSSAVISYQSDGHPLVNGFNDTICENEQAWLTANSNSSSDTLAWYDASSGGNLIQYGSALQTSALTQNETYWVEAVRGNLYYNNSLFTTSNSTTNFNGVMFDIVAHEDLVIDSLSMKINTVGLQGVLAYHRNGSHQGFENTPTSWQVWGSDAVMVNNAGDFLNVSFGEVNLAAGDTLGVYLHMQLGSSNLSYTWLPNPVTRTNNEMSVIAGSGVSSTFNNVYTPREWNGEVFYHHGDRPQGDCVSERVPVEAIVNSPQIDLGNDTTIFDTDSLWINATNGSSYYLWNTGNMDSIQLVDAATFGIGPNVFYVITEDAFGCMASDTILVTIIADTTTSIQASNIDLNFQIYPNPSRGQFRCNFGDQQPVSLMLFALDGSLIHRVNRPQNGEEIEVNLAPGQLLDSSSI